MPIIRDDENLTTSNIRLSLGELLNTFAFLLKAITGESSWRTPASISIAELAQKQSYPGPKGDKGDKGDTGAQGVQGPKGDRGEPAPLDHTHAITQVEGLQTALNAKAAIDHDHSPSAWQDIPLSSGWSNYGVGFVTPQCRKLVGNLIEVRGTIKKSSTPVANEVVATLPVGYRPSATMFFITWASNGYFRFQLDTNGSMKFISGNIGGVGLNFIFGLN